MSTASAPRLAQNPDRFAAAVCERLAAGNGVRRRVPGGRLHIDRPLPFLCVHRRPPDAAEGTERLLYGQPSYLSVSGDEGLHEATRRLVRRLASALAERFGSFLVLEVWESCGDEGEAEVVHPPRFDIYVPTLDGTPTTAEVLGAALAEVRGIYLGSEVEIFAAADPAPPGMRPLLSGEEARELGVLLVGLEVPQRYTDPEGTLLPAVLRELQVDVGRAVQQAAFEFAQVQTSFEVKDARALGRRAVDELVGKVDRELLEICSAFSYLLMTTPINVDQAWDEFVDHGYRREPTFRYRPLTADPDLLKRRLYEIEMERIEDPSLAALFRAQRREIDRKLTLLDDRDTPAFLHESLQLFGSADDSLLALAQGVMQRIDREDRGDGSDGALDARAFARLAEQEIERYREGHAGFEASVQVRDDVPGVLVSKGQVLIGSRYRVAETRADALIAHEVGTHLVTFVNGCAQPLRQLQIGLPGYEETQEGVAVLAEYAAGGLTPARMALLAARVVAVHRHVTGHGFTEIFAELVDGHGLAPQRAFHVTMRVVRGGGLTKDVVYLRGLAAVLDYLAGGGRLDTLLVGKLHLDFVPIIEELQWRQVLRPAPVRPHWLDLPGAQERLTEVRQGLTVLDLMEKSRA